VSFDFDLFAGFAVLVNKVLIRLKPCMAQKCFDTMEEDNSIVATKAFYLRGESRSVAVLEIGYQHSQLGLE